MLVYIVLTVRLRCKGRLTPNRFEPNWIECHCSHLMKLNQTLTLKDTRCSGNNPAEIWITRYIQYFCEKRLKRKEKRKKNWEMKEKIRYI